MTELTLREKAALVVGAGFWGTVGIERAGIPPLIITDGPRPAQAEHRG